MNKRKEIFNENKPLIPLSKMANADPKTVPRKRRPFISSSPMNNPKVLKAVNQHLKGRVSDSIQDIWDKEGGSLRNKFFMLDHTAEVLENYRRIQENELFQHILFDEREKKAFLRHESRKIENLIEGYEQKF